MSSGSTCRECGTAIPADSPGGFCAQCLLGLGLENPEDQPESATDPVEQDPDAPKSPAESLSGAASGFPSLTEKSGERIKQWADAYGALPAPAAGTIPHNREQQQAVIPQPPGHTPRR